MGEERRVARALRDPREKRMKPLRRPKKSRRMMTPPLPTMLLLTIPSPLRVISLPRERSPNLRMVRSPLRVRNLPRKTARNPRAKAPREVAKVKAAAKEEKAIEDLKVRSPLRRKPRPDQALCSS